MGKATKPAPQSDENLYVPAPPYEAVSDHLQPFIAGTRQSNVAKVNDDGRVNFDLRSSDLEPLEGLFTQTVSAFDQLNGQQTLHAVDCIPPQLNIVMQVVGSQGDVQPFVALGIALQSHGHRVRIATHPQFRQFVKSYGLEFFSIGGDPAELMAYMVKNPGLFPKLITIQRGEVHKRRRAMREIMHACWKSCYDSSDEPASTDHETSKPFVADAIIANPPSFAHVHCAEKLGIPLHMVFTMPWSPTRELPHPLAVLDTSQADAKIANFLSYFLIDALIWQGLGDIVNRFRKDILDLEPIDPTQAPGFISRLKIPQTYCWSPSLVSKPVDWPVLTTVSGYFNLAPPVDYSPSPALMHFLNAGDPPVYIGFGSIVVDDPVALTKVVLEAIKIAGVRAIISKGWASLGSQPALSAASSSSEQNPNIFFLSSCPHHWLFPRVSCVVHHGGAGTTAAGLAAGKPTVVVPFFGDQPFWGNMIHRNGIGPQPIPAKELTAEKLAAAITDATTDLSLRRRAFEIRQQISVENGLKNAVDHFHRCLPDSVFAKRDVEDRSRLHVWQYTKKKGKKSVDVGLSATVATVLRKEKLIDWNDLKLIRHQEYDVAHYGPHEPISGAALAIGDLFYESFRGMGEICYEFLGAPYKSSVHVWRKNMEESKKQQQLRSIPEDTRTAMLSQQYGEKSLDAKTNSDDGDSSLYSRSPTGESSTSSASTSKRYIPGRYVLTGTLRVGKAAARAPGAFAVGMARGAHNIPTLWGDRTVRPQAKVTGVGSGVKEGVKELTFGVADGISGLFVQPVLGFMESGPLGFVKGAGKGVLGLPVKFFAAASGIVGYPLKGIDVAATNAMKSGWSGDGGLKAVRQARMAMGEIEYRDASVEERQGVLDWWGEMVLGKDSG